MTTPILKTAAMQPPVEETSSTPPQPKVSTLWHATLNVILIAIVTAGYVLYYYRHLDEVVHSRVSEFAAAGTLIFAVACRTLLTDWLRPRLWPRLASLAEKLLASGGLTVAVVFLLVVLGALFITTSSIVLHIPEGTTETRRFDLEVHANGRPFSVLRLSISPQHHVAYRIVVGRELFTPQRMTFVLREPPELESPDAEEFAPWSRIRFTPSNFRTATLYPALIVPGPSLLYLLPRRNGSPPSRRYFVRVLSNKGMWLYRDAYKGILVTGASDKDLPTSLDEKTIQLIPKFFLGRSGKALQGASLDMLTTNVMRLPSAHFSPGDTVTIEAGILGSNGAPAQVIATEPQQTIGTGATLVFLDRTR